MLELKHLSRAYEGKPLLTDITFRVKTGETVCLLGASGSGKSTLLRMIAGLEPPDSGQILFDGVELGDTPAHLRDFALVFQDYELFPHLNVFDNVAFGLRMRKVPPLEIEARVGALLAQMNMDGFARRSVTDLSGGEQQRVALARALITRPRLLMLDEPLGALDRSLKEELLGELRTTLRKTKVPAIYVTHDQEEAFAIADRILLLHDGRIVRAGTPADIWSDPRSAWVAGFLGVGQVVEGMQVARGRVKTAFGEFAITCAHKHSKAEKIPLLIRPSATGRAELKVRVQDVRFRKDHFEARTQGGLVIQLTVEPKIGQVVRVRVKVECLHEDPKEESRGGVGLSV